MITYVIIMTGKTWSAEAVCGDILLLLWPSRILQSLLTTSCKKPYTEVGSSFQPVCNSGKLILQQQEMWIIMWIIINIHFCRGGYIFSLGQIKSDILKWKCDTVEYFLNLEYTTSSCFSTTKEWSHKDPTSVCDH